MHDLVITLGAYRAWIVRNGDVALVRVYRRNGDDWGEQVACYETTSRGAAASARRTMRNLEA